MKLDNIYLKPSILIALAASIPLATAHADETIRSNDKVISMTLHTETVTSLRKNKEGVWETTGYITVSNKESNITTRLLYGATCGSKGGYFDQLDHNGKPISRSQKRWHMDGDSMRDDIAFRLCKIGGNKAGSSPVAAVDSGGGCGFYGGCD